MARPDSLRSGVDGEIVERAGYVIEECGLSLRRLAAPLLHDWKTLWGKAAPDERRDIVVALFGEVRVRDKNIVSATLADQQYAPLIASSEAHRLRPMAPETPSDETVGLAPPDGLRGAQPTFSVEGVAPLVMELLAA